MEEDQIRKPNTTCSALLAGLLLAGALSGCGGPAGTGTALSDILDGGPGIALGQPADDFSGGGFQPQEAGEALSALETIPVKGRAPKTGYSREEFGPAWADVDRNGCDTRNDILARDLEAETFKPGTRDCVVTAGLLADKYTGTTISFVRGDKTSAAVQIDHLVPLSDAWQKGARQLSAEQRKQFANDPLNLMAADGPTNGAKGDKDAATWLPPNKAFRCEYVARQTAVKAKYQLWVTPAEHEAIAAVLAGCLK
ncbi:HNH endonuclease [Pseudarthrobacter phenanthrenivorans]|uniref:HNH endonuclease family protein n=1 Tax=Pseudarthrobacter phenanthrenivorans TaxID=361575 RepID=UPI001129611D|nr:HNH endonuclease family protein [Pseudarthrobacter phenanthrenivorans]TPV53343.1 HNH endonuclease [Pseudarthrobacter phenanthrenivorans]